MKNPFRYEFIEEDPELINRVKERERIREALLERGSRLLVQGRRRMGKTTVCKAVVNELRREKHAVMLVDFSTATQLADLSNALLRGITASLGKSWQDYATDLMKSLSLQLETEADPQTGAIKLRLKPSARKAPLDEQRGTFIGILNRANALAKKKKIHLGIVIDEFQELGRFEEEATLWNLRGEIQHHANLSYVFTGSRAHLIKMLMSSDRAFYKMFRVLNFESIEIGEMRTWLAKRFRDHKIKAEPLLDDLLALSETCTVDRLRLAAMCFPMALRAGELTEEIIQTAHAGIIEEDKAFFHSDWQQLTAHQQNVLRALAEGETKLTSESVRDRYSLPTSGSVTNTLKSLFERGILYELEMAPGYAFDNPYFRHWVHLRNRDDLGLG
ncbi:ATP-binding protein [Puniceicoccales bacterium CK1056]|uniref:ATP-binding protein n=1 Tax=Oceanipulchritudo coccoides TaxID=2706888 RepID=A0A6B2M1X3_9BACT|nr:ATP-binding protein [Oceanipulchritudo coccoides]